MATKKILTDIDLKGKIDATGTVLGSNLSGTNTGDQDLSGYVETTTLSSYIRSDVNDIFTGRLTGNQLWLGGGVITGMGSSVAKLQVNGVQRTGSIYLHELSSGVPTADAIELGNNAGDLEWDGDTVYHTGNLTLSGSNTGDQDLSGLLLNTTDTLDGSLTVDGGTGVATSGGTLIVRQKGDTIADGIAITSSNASSHRIWKDSSGNLNIGGSGNGSSFKQDLNGNLAILGTTSSPKFYVGTASASSQWAFQARNSASTSDSGLYFNSGSANIFLRNSSNTLTTRIDSNGVSYFKGGNVGIGTDAPQSELHVSSGDSTETTLIVGASGTINDVSSRILLNEGEAGVTNSKDYGFSLAYDGQGSNYGLAANTFGILRHNNSATGVAALTIQRSNGNVGIGTTSPDAKVDIVAGTNNGLRISATDTNNNWRDITIRSYTSESEAGNLAEGVHMFTTNPSGATGNAFSKYGGFVIDCRDDGNSSFAIRVGSGLTEAFFINNNAAAIFSSNVTATNFILSSDKRLKENIKKVDNKHIDVDWKTFEMKSDNSKNRYGVIAQELEEVHPEFVRTDDKGMKSVAYIDLLIAKIAELEARLDKANI